LFPSRLLLFGGVVMKDFNAVDAAAQHGGLSND